jgi:RNA polymerase sigma-70 factor (ECF subfamily)
MVQGDTNGTGPTEGRAETRDSSERITPLSLLERARTNDPEAWRRLIDLYRPLVQFWCGRGRLRPEDSEDVVQEVFAAAAAGLTGFRRDRPGDTFRGWLRGISRNQLLLHFRRNQGRPRAAGGPEAAARLEEVADPLATSDKDEEQQIGQLYRRALEQVRAEFEERTWQAFWLVAIDDRPLAEVAGELGVTPGAIRQAKSRVLRRLKQEVGDLLG